MNKSILLTGGTGYIGAHTAVELINDNHQVIIVDNLSNSSIEVLDRIEQITGVKPKFYELDVRSPELEKVFQENSIDAVIHFAGLKAVGESVEKPLEYYDNNLGSSLNLLQTMKKFAVKKIVFSSSATVYGNQKSPLDETSQTGVGITNPYGQTKFMIEQIIQDVCVADKDFQATILRYFNPIGAHQSGLIGEEPSGIPNNLLPYVLKVATGELPAVRVFGDDYDTPDGTGIRDYIHVVDLAKGHLRALQKLDKGCAVFNLGTGKGSSVLEVVRAVEAACGHQLKKVVEGRRAGDLDVVYAKTDKAEQLLDWKAEQSVDQACTDSWRWVSQKSQ